ncbi:MAG: Rpn family recombination-promoting nuclease/putative transposase [Planctomycetaceae bacterium]|jgi:hypothetical protein|nr:Rpn family recombination-promoting nuclease/putative transposase [Planctomycetaceae bacterium]
MLKNQNVESQTKPAVESSAESQVECFTWDKTIEEQFQSRLVNHDIFFELVFQLKKVACAFAIFLLSLELREQLDIPNLKISVRRFRDDNNFKESRADMVYEIPLKNAKDKHVKIYIVIEHKSYDYSHTISQLLKYETQIIETEIELAKKEERYTADFKLPPIILVIFHHGDSAYTGSTELRDEFMQIKGIENLILNQQAIVLDLFKMKKNDLPRIKNVPELYIALRIMQIILNKDLKWTLENDDDMLEELKPYVNDPDCRNFARIFHYYVLDSSRKLTETVKKQFSEKLNQIFKESDMISPLNVNSRYIDIGKKEGIEIGIEIGMEKGMEIGIIKERIEAIISLLDVKFGEISETVRKPLQEITNIENLKDILQFAKKSDTFEEFNNKLQSLK